MRPTTRAFVELLAAGLTPAKAAAVMGFSEDSSNLSKRLRHPAVKEGIRALQEGGSTPLRYAFAAGVLRHGSRAAAYRLAYPCEGVRPATIRKRAAKAAVEEASLAALLELVREWKCAVHTGAHPVLDAAVEAERRAEAKQRAFAGAARMAAYDRQRGYFAPRLDTETQPSGGLKRFSPQGEKLTGRRRKRCGARARSRGGAPCQCKVVPGRTRCKFHGGMSTGPRTPEGKARSAEGTRRYFEGLRATKGLDGAGV